MVKLWSIRFSTLESFAFNLSSNVGTKSPNLADDVQLAQLGFRAMSLSIRQSFLTPEDRLAFARVPWGPPCTGQEDDPLVIAIRFYQKNQPFATQDGHISVMANREAQYQRGQFKQQYSFANMILAIKEVHLNVWPNLHRIDGCPAALKRASNDMMGDFLAS